MALIRCSECGREVSDKAPSCPNCGSTINSSVVQVSNSPGQTLKIEPELTSKKWKIVKLVSWLVIIVGLVSAGPLGDSVPDGQYIGFTIAILGSVVLIVGKVGAWYSDKRTR
ncbi:MAG: zinc-ribbon domain-containing protein [Patescibacteria group bacterium]